MTGKTSNSQRHSARGAADGGFLPDYASRPERAPRAGHHINHFFLFARLFFIADYSRLRVPAFLLTLSLRCALNCENISHYQNITIEISAIFSLMSLRKGLYGTQDHCLV